LKKGENKRKSSIPQQRETFFKENEMTNKDKFNSLVENMIQKIENGETGTWIKPWSCGLPKNFMTKKHYSGANILFLWLEAEEKGYKSNNWLTFNQIKKLGGTVKKGEKSFSVFFFKPLEIKEENEEGEEVKKTIPLLKTYNVFNIEQTTLEIDTKEVETIPEIEEFISNTGARIKNAQEAFFNPARDYIGIPDITLFKSEEHYYSTLLHELSHWTGHSTRLNRDLKGRFGSESYAFEELIAETSSMFLNSYLGVDYSKMRHTEYIQSWLKALKTEPSILWKVASEAQKIFTYLNELQNVEKVA
jgi:antirestriction protein ArdC